MVSYPYMKAALHQIREGFSQYGTARVVMDIVNHCVSMTVVKTDGVIVVVVEERPSFLLYSA